MTESHALMLAQSQRIAALEDKLNEARELLVKRGEACANCFELDKATHYCTQCEFQIALDSRGRGVAKSYCSECAPHFLVLESSCASVCHAHKS